MGEWRRRLDKARGVETLNTATNLARHTIRQLIELGISDFVLSPGSRNAPLSIALYEAHQRGLIELHIRIDERSAAFFALGIAKATNRYVPVICTSGTAVANYYPAVLEAHHSDIKLLILSADRPARVRNTGANQTTNQKEIFQNFVSVSIDTATAFDAKKSLNGSGPIHFNLQFDEPLLTTDSTDWLLGIHVSEPKGKTKVKGEVKVLKNRSVIVVGHDRAGFEISEIEAFAKSLGALLIAEDPLSFKDSIAYAPILLSSEKARNDLTPDITFVIGRTTLSRSINNFIQGAKYLVVIDPRMENVDTARTADEMHFDIPRIKETASPDNEWINLWRKYEILAAKSISELPDWCESSIAKLIASEIHDDSALFIASSRPIRDLESFASPRSGIKTFANRGLAGIDGNISVAMGIATRFQESVAIIGDLGFLHDVSALTNVVDVNLLIIVIDNNGGGIFSTLPQRGVPGFESIFGTPHGIDIAKVASSYGISNVIVKNSSDLSHEIAHLVDGVRVVVVKVPDREENANTIANVLKKYSELVVL